MGLSNYVSACKSLAQELADSLTSEDVSALRADLAKMGKGEWSRWIARNHPVASTYLEATPSERKKKKSLQFPDDDRRKVILAAAVLALEGYAILQMIDEYRLEPGASYRHMAATAASACSALLHSLPDVWPFGEPTPWPEDE